MVSKAVVLSTIWEKSRGSYVYLPRKNRAGRWEEGEALTVADAVTKVPFMPAGEGDLFFSPLRYNGPRRKGSVGAPGVIFADLDGDHVQEPRLLPSIIVVSSPGHYHAYWLLDEPADPAEWEAHSKGWTQEIGGDPAGWDITQVLRVPHTRNHKYSPGETVGLQAFHPDRVYRLDEFPSATVVTIEGPAGDVPVPDRAQRDAIYLRASSLNTLPLASRYWLTVTKDELAALGKIDRSRVLWALMRSLLEAGLSPDTVFNLVYFASVNKWGADAGRLWADVQRAVAAS